MAASPTPGGGGIGAILAAGDRDYLVRNSGEQVKISGIEGDTVALYFSASWCPPCRRFTPKLIEAYKELTSLGKSFEVVFVSGDQDEEAFNAYFAKMPWLAVPFSDSEGRKNLDERFEVNGIPHLVFLDAKTGEVLTDEGVEFVSEYGIEAYPFTTERINELKEQEKAAKDNQTIHSVLGTANRAYVISNTGKEVPIVDLEGKYVGICFVVNGYPLVEEFTSVLAKIYAKLKEVGEKFEVVAVSLDSDEESFNTSFSSMPWLAIPQGDKMCQKLVSYFELSDLPTLVLIGPDGKTLSSNIAGIIDEHGLDAWEGFPFSAEKLEILAEKAKAKAASQTLESLLVTGDLDFVIGKDGAKVPVAELVGKTVLLYFSAKWCGPCRAFLPTLVDVYNKIKEKNSDFEIVFISSDKDQSSFDDFFSGMPWLAIPLEDERKADLKKRFKIRGIPSLVAIGPDGKTVNTDAKTSLAVHGADAFPFTDERIEELEKKIDEMAKGWPEKLKHELHEHELVLVRRRRPYGCDGCEEMGNSWSYNCAECDFDLHTKCALGEEKKGEEVKGQEDAAAPAGYVCEGDVCRKA
ncbi:probable nucleoredoxin 1-2 [Hordeum vulgare subsp. vulgare]|uniref:protein-disulfide reductase n=1 Tax=Hordeum vulgare subsp. vulgare TaxID=112509 RepID=A0A8I7B831_HORVV|nr:probable nucleoredoxin 1-2 [Hordeum vulgare subsp. vulgare]